MPTIEEQKEILRKKNPTIAHLIKGDTIVSRDLITHKAAVKQLLKDCKISAPANEDKTVVTKKVVSHKSFKVVTSIDYMIEVSGLPIGDFQVEELSPDLLAAKREGLISTKLIKVEKSKQVDIQNYSYTTKIKTDIQTLQGVK